MKDNIEEFVNERRDEFDIHEPPDHLWEAINKKLHPETKARSYRMQAIAASILLVIGFAIWYMFIPGQKTTQTLQTMSAMKPEVKDAEFYYASMIKTQQKEITQYCSEYPGLCKDFKNEIDTLHILYGQLKTEYTNTNNNEAVLQAMLENLQAQVKLLTMQLQIIQDIKRKGSKEIPHLKTT